MRRPGLYLLLPVALLLVSCSSDPAVFRGMKVGMPASEFRAAFPQAEEQERGFSEGVHMIRYQMRPGNGVNFAECYFKSQRLTGAVLFFDNVTRIESVIWELSAANGKPDIDQNARTSRVIKWGETLTLFQFTEPRVMELPTGEKRRLNGIVMFLGS